MTRMFRKLLDIFVRVMAWMWGKRCPRCGRLNWGTPYCQCGIGVSLSDVEAIFVILTSPFMIRLFLRAFRLGTVEEIYWNLRFPVA